LIGETGRLWFAEWDVATKSWVPATGQLDGDTVALSSAYLLAGQQQVTQTPRSGLPQVELEFSAEGADLVEQITTRLIGKPIAISVDDKEITAPTVQAPVTSNVPITGLSLEEARVLQAQLNAGELPVPVVIEEATFAVSP
jgi:preprotein translocase subunit SecD